MLSAGADPNLNEEVAKKVERLDGILAPEIKENFARNGLNLECTNQWNDRIIQQKILSDGQINHNQTFAFDYI